MPEPSTPPCNALDLDHPDYPRAELPEPPAAKQTTLIVVGGYSDLAKTLLFKALEELNERGHSKQTRILFVDIKEASTEEFREYAQGVLEAEGISEEKIKTFCKKIYYAPCPDQEENPGYTKERLEKLFQGGAAEKSLKSVKKTRWLIHLALGQEHALDFIESLPPAIENIDWILHEKPLGSDAESAKKTISRLEATSYGQENKIRAIDHYLAKTMVLFLVQLKKMRNQESGEFRQLFKDIQIFLDPQWWDSVNVVMTETKNLAERKQTYEAMGGILEDMVQSHLIQTVAAVMAIIDPTAENAFDKASGDFISKIAEAKITKAGQYIGFTMPDGEYQPSPKTLTAVEGQFSLEPEPEVPNIPFDFEVAKAVGSKKNTMICISYKTPVLFRQGQPDQMLVDQFEFHLSENYVKLKGRIPDKDEPAESVNIPVAQDGNTPNMSGYANLYLSVINGQMNGTLSLSNILKAWEITEQMKESAEQLPEIKNYAQGTRF